jgi:alpha,alpha-trehalase
MSARLRFRRAPLVRLCALALLAGCAALAPAFAQSAPAVQAARATPASASANPLAALPLPLPPAAPSAAPTASPAAAAGASAPAPAASAASAAPAAASATAVTPEPPSIAFGPLYRDVELAHLYPDSKTFADMNPDAPPAQIVAAYARARATPGFSLAAFVRQHFTLPAPAGKPYVSDPEQNVVAHIDTLWNVLRRNPAPPASPWSSLLPLPAPYIVPGGRFDEIYYWDSYFIMLGLEQSGQHALVDDMLKNFASLIDRYGHIPNGNRSYYLSRSQPPFFAQMVALAAHQDGAQTYLRALPELQREYAYWMAGSDTLAPGHATRHVVKLSDGTLLNRYWDARAAPRDESYLEDVEIARRTPQRAAADLWRNLRAGGETGWDFSSRWFADDRTLGTIDVTSLIPVDLNCLLYQLERTLAHAYRLKGDVTRAENLEQRAQVRAAAIRRLLWDPALHAFGDYDFADGRLTHRLTAATVYPLYAGIATREQANEVAATLRRGLLRPGGLATTQVDSGQQWDEPNGWAPLQYLAVTGLRRYGQQALARTIATRWIRTNVAYYERTGKLVEKYDVDDPNPAVSAGGGEYPLQDGFGWTNGVLRVLLAQYPDAVDVRASSPASAAAAPSR